MQKNTSLFANLSWQTILQIINTVTPLITIPYLSRVLGPVPLGEYSYTFSIVSLFTMIAMLGNMNYGVREISIVRDDKIERSIIFKEIYCIQFACAIFALIAFIPCVFLLKRYSLTLAIQSLWILNCFFDITWLYSGLERFKYIAIRGIIVKIIAVSCIFIFVKNSDDLWIYTLLMSLSFVIGNAILVININSIVDLKQRIRKDDLTKHFRATFFLFIPVAAASIFHLMDKIMLGSLSTMEQSGFYHNSDRLVSVPITIIVGLCNVMLSRMSYEQKRNNDFESLFYNYSELIYAIGIAMAFGIGAVSNVFVPLFFGEGYEPCISLVKIFMFVMIVKTVSNVIMAMYIIPKKYDYIYVRSYIIGAVTNIIANYFLIYTLGLGALGATIGTLIAETTVVIVQLIMLRGKIRISLVFKQIAIYCIMGAVMYIIVSAIYLMDIPVLIKLICQILSGVIVFGGMLILKVKITKKPEVLLKVINH